MWKSWLGNTVTVQIQTESRQWGCHWGGHKLRGGVSLHKGNAGSPSVCSITHTSITVAQFSTSKVWSEEQRYNPVPFYKNISVSLRTCVLEHRFSLVSISCIGTLFLKSTRGVAQVVDQDSVQIPVLPAKNPTYFHLRMSLMK
jgi:hypothetical protein